MPRDGEFAWAVVFIVVGITLATFLGLMLLLR